MTQSLVVFIREVEAMTGLSGSSISRKCAEGKFVAPISTPGGKRRWLRADVEQYLVSQSTLTQPTARNKRRSAKAFSARQDATDRAIERFQGKGGAK